MTTLTRDDAAALLRLLTGTQDDPRTRRRLAEKIAGDLADSRPGAEAFRAPRPIYGADGFGAVPVAHCLDCDGPANEVCARSHRTRATGGIVTAPPCPDCRFPLNNRFTLERCHRPPEADQEPRGVKSWQAASNARDHVLVWAERLAELVEPGTDLRRLLEERYGPVAHALEHVEIGLADLIVYQAAADHGGRKGGCDHRYVPVGDDGSVPCSLPDTAAGHQAGWHIFRTGGRAYRLPIGQGDRERWSA